MKAATENVEFSIDAARKVARMTGRPVTLHVDRRAEGSSAIGFSPRIPNSSTSAG
jgi:hypothetical protein